MNNARSREGNPISSANGPADGRARTGPERVSGHALPWPNRSGVLMAAGSRWPYVTCTSAAPTDG